MKVLFSKTVLLSLAVFSLVPSAQATMLIAGWHNFSAAGNTSNADDIAAGFSGVSSRSFNDNAIGGSNDGNYGDSQFAAPSGPGSGNGNANFRKGIPAYFTITNNNASNVGQLGTLFFDAARGDLNGQTFSIAYQYGPLNPSGSFTTLATSLSSPLFAAGNTLASYTNFAISLLNLPGLAANQSLSFRFLVNNSSAGNMMRIDNVAITAVPEPASLLALGCVLGSGLLLRTRRRMPFAVPQM